MKNKVFIIAEAGVNHNGRLDLAIQLCDTAKQAGADAVKFQTWKTEKLISESAEQADYQKLNTSSDISQFEMLKTLELSYDDFKQIHAHCTNIGIEFLSTPDEEDSLDFLSDILQLPWLKIGSGEVTNLPYLRKIGAKKKKIVLSTGMSNLGQIERALNELRASGAPAVTLLHCTTNYPCPMPEVNLLAMRTLAKAFGTPVGYSDHTLGIEVPIAAVALGAILIEKHFTLDPHMPGPDHLASADPMTFKAMVSGIRAIEAALGDGIKKPNPSELRISKAVQKFIVASIAIQPGDKLGPHNMAIKRSGGQGLPPDFWDHLTGLPSRFSFQVDEPIRF